MTDPNIFDELMKLLNQPGPINWALAEQITDHVAGQRQPIDPWLAEEYIELTRLAQLRVTEATGLDAGPLVEVIPVDTNEWARRNLKSFRYLIEPIAEKLSSAPSAGPMDAVLRPLVPALLGMQMGATIGALSQRVLGQFDVGLPTADAGDLLFVVPNIEAFAVEHDLDPRQVRLWVALHEVTHQVQFGRPWVRDHFQTLIDRYVESVDLDTTAFGSGVEDFNDPERVREMLEEGGGLPSFLSGPDQTPQLEAIQAFMAIIEGYGDHMMDSVAGDLLPDLAAMRGAMDRRRGESAGHDPLAQLLGMDEKLAQYELGARFCREVESRWGTGSLHRLWEQPENLPSMDELHDATGWAARVLLDDPFAD